MLALCQACKLIAVGMGRDRYKRIPASLGGGRTYERPVRQDAILDADQLTRFQWLSVSQQERLAAQVGVDRHQLLSHIRDMVLSVMCF